MPQDYATLAQQFGGTTKLATSRSDAAIDYDALAKMFGGGTDPQAAWHKAETIGPAKVGDRYTDPSPNPAKRLIQMVTGGEERPASVAAMDPFGVEAALKGAGQVPIMGMSTAEAPKGIRAFHGSPHDFEAFSMSKIGSGEGAQAYGHGLYFAENPDVAGEYARKLTSRGTTSEPEVLERYFQPGRIVNGYGGKDKVLAFHPGTPEQGWAVTVQRVDGAGNPVERPRTHATAPSHAEVRDALSPGRQGMYEVAIDAHPAQFLDWDKPLSQQSEAVKAALHKAGVAPNPAILHKLPHGWDETGRDFYNAASHSPDITNPMLRPFAGAPEQATEALRQAGIPGIKYLDQGSRAAGEGSRNYVVFDDALVKILRKYAVALPAIQILRKQAIQHPDGAVPESAVMGAIASAKASQRDPTAFE